MKKINIAIDGLSGVGKGTYAKILANNLGYKILNAGDMYRAVTKYCLDYNLHFNDIRDGFVVLDDFKIDFKKSGNYIINGKSIGGNNLTSDNINNNVSKFANVPQFKEYIFKKQKEMISKEKGWIGEGRNMALDVMRDADLKIYFTGDLEIRAKRRLLQLKEKNPNFYSGLELVIDSLKFRDEQDFNHKLGPLVRPENALCSGYDIIVDTTEFDNINDNYNRILNLVKNYL